MRIHEHERQADQGQDQYRQEWREPACTCMVVELIRRIHGRHAQWMCIAHARTGDVPGLSRTRDLKQSYEQEQGEGDQQDRYDRARVTP